MTALNLSLRKKIGILQGGFLLLIALIMLVTFWVNTSNKKSALVVNLAGRQRMLSQKMTKEVLGISREMEAEDKVKKVVQLLIETRNHLARTIAAQKGFDLNQHSVGFIPAKAAKEIAAKFTAGTEMMLKQTSLKPRNQENAPDPFEAGILKMFEMDRALDEYKEKVVEKDGKQYIRFMKRLVVIEACLKCHEKRENVPAFIRKNYPGDQAYDYQVGDIRGAISIKVPLYGSVADYGQSVKETMGLFDKSLKVLIDGGETIGPDGKAIHLPATSDAEIKRTLEEGANFWNEFRKNIEVIVRPGMQVDSEDFRKALTFVETNNSVLLKKMDTATTLFQEEANKNIAFQEKALIWISLLSLAGMATAFWIVNRSVIKPLEGLGKKLVLSSSGLLGTADNMLKGMQIQASRVHQSAAATEEMSATVVDVAKNAQAADASVKDAVSLAEKGMMVVSKTTEGMQRVSDTVKESAGCIESLDRDSKKIGEIVSVIDDIADQTNLLALNAAIEAARAGEQGRGFAVVADEVRKLAEKTSKATKEISTRVEEIRRGTTCVVGSMHTNVELVKQEAEHADQAGRSLKDIVAAVQNVSTMISHIAVASGQQAAAADEVATNLTNISAISDDTSGGAQNVVDSCHELSDMADQLQGMLKGKA